jgi:hypothetical protein
MISQGIATSRYDMVGHSMGGILERLYIQEVDNEHTNKLITLNTPHFGAPLGNVAPILFSYIDNLPTNIISIFANKFFNPTGGREAVSDLAIGSDAITNLNSNNYRLKNIPVFAVGSYLDANVTPEYNQNIEPGMMSEESTFLLAHIFYDEVPKNRYNFLFADDVWGDGVVSISSQEGGLSPCYCSIFGGLIDALHINTPKWETTMDEIRLLLLSDPDSYIFSMNGFGDLPQNEMAKYIHRNNSSNYITRFAEPRPESYIKISANFDEINTSICHTAVDFSSDMSTTMVFSFLSPDRMISSYDNINSSFNLMEERESLTLYAIGRTSYNALLVDSITINNTDNSGVKNLIFDATDIKPMYSISRDNLIIREFPNNYTVTIYNSSGTKIKEYIQNNNGYYDISSLSHGLYIVTISSYNKFYSFKFSK